MDSLIAGVVTTPSLYCADNDHGLCSELPWDCGCRCHAAPRDGAGHKLTPLQAKVRWAQRFLPPVLLLFEAIDAVVQITGRSDQFWLMTEDDCLFWLAWTAGARQVWKDWHASY